MVRVFEFECPEYESHRSSTLVISAFGSVCLMLIALFSFLKYILCLAQMINGLMMVDKFLISEYGVQYGLDWTFFAPVGSISILFEIYCLTMTVFVLLEEYERVVKFLKKLSCGKLLAHLNLFITFAVASVTISFCFISSLYHYLIIHKVLSLSLGGPLVLEVFKNNTNATFTGIIAMVDDVVDNHDISYIFT